MGRDMKAKSFELEDLNDYRLFYKLNKFSGFDMFEIYHQRVEGRELFDDHMVLNLYGDLVVAIPDMFQHTGKYNLIASDGVKEEIISMQPFERIWEIYKQGHNNDNPGSFGFFNSLPALDETRGWRCDYGLYGPEFFTDPLGNAVTQVPEDLSGLLVYEPILSINGVGHLIQSHMRDTSHREGMLNDTYTPFASMTLGGVVKLLTEWAAVSDSPFDNTEEIATIAKKFCDDLGITETLVSNQPDMQIYKYLQGDENARVAPTPVMFSDEFDLFIKRNMAHSSLSSILVLYPEIQIDLNLILDIELGLVDKDVVDFLSFVVRDDSIDLFDREQVLAYLDANARRPGLPAFARNKLSFLDTKKKLLLNIKETGTF